MSDEVLDQIRLPLVEVYETIEGEGRMAGYPTIFIRLFGCQMRCTWCDTPYSYAPAEPEEIVSIPELLEKLKPYRAQRICLTGGEPLIHGERFISLLNELVKDPRWQDIHIETNGAIDIRPFVEAVTDERVRYVMDYKLPGSGEFARMDDSVLRGLRQQDELKFVIADDQDYQCALGVIQRVPIAAQLLFSPVFESMTAAELAQRIVNDGLNQVKLNLQIHKIIWPPAQRRV